MIRKIASFITGTALLVTLVLWAASYLSIYYRGPRFLVTAYAGHFQYLSTDLPWAERPDPDSYAMGWSVRGYDGFGTLWWPWYTSAARYWTIHLPLWIPASIFALLFPLASVPLYRLWHRRRNGLCLRCGYNLEGNVSGVCPECGEAIGQDAR